MAVGRAYTLRQESEPSLRTIVLGVLIFIDDYFNCLTVGSVMRPITDKHQVSRAKLAYLIDATAAPVCIIAPISSWAGGSYRIRRGRGRIFHFFSVPFHLTITHF